MKNLESGLVEAMDAIHRLDREAKNMIGTLGILAREADKATCAMNKLIDVMLERQCLIERFNQEEHQ